MTLFATGFRPFFLLAAVWAVVAPVLWVAVLQDQMALHSPLPPLAWHIHEMLFGFTGAVIAGFLLTAVRNWTKQPTLTGPSLAFVAGLWVMGRVQTFVELGDAGLVLDLAFFPAIAFGIGRPLLATRNRRNAVFPLLLLALGVADAALHAGWLTPRLIGQVGLDVVTLIMVIIGGRVIPMFTRNAIPGVVIRGHAVVERISVLGVVALLVADGVGALVGPIALVVGLANLVRLGGWDTVKTVRAPIVWVLHLAYLWIAVALVSRGVSELVMPIPSGSLTHLLTIGGIGTLTLGMMSRVALGHTGRRIVAAPSIAVAFGLMSAATVLRALWTGGEVGLLWAAAIAFGAAFAVYTVVYVPILVQPRADGRPG